MVQVLLSLIVATMFWTNGDGLVAVLHVRSGALGVRSRSRRSMQQGNEAKGAGAWDSGDGQAEWRAAKPVAAVPITR